MLNEGINIENDEIIINFNHDNPTDIVKLQLKNKLLNIKTIRGLQIFYCYKIRTEDSAIRTKLLKKIKSKDIDENQYNLLITKAIMGLNDIEDVDLILIPKSSSSLNLDIAQKIKNRRPNTQFISEGVLKNSIENISIDMELAEKYNLKPETISALQYMIKKASVDGEFQIKKISPRFRKFIVNLLKFNTDKEKQIFKLANEGKVLIIDDYVNEGTTLRSLFNLLNSLNPKQIILFTLFI